MKIYHQKGGEMKQAKSVIIGLLIVALGLIVGGNALGLFNFNVFFDGWWTLFIIIPCFIELLTDDNKIGSLIGITAGVLLLLAAQDVMTYAIAGKLIFAIIIITIGLSITFKGTFRSHNDKEVEKKIKENKGGDNMDAQVAVFSGSDRAYKSEEFTGSNLTAIFGGVDLDLMDAKFTKDTVIKAFCLFGGIDIHIPKNVQVKTKSGFIFGGVSDDRKDVPEDAKYTIYLDVAGGFGGISIEDKSKR
jgi:predicted membrane protein